ncbi:glycoside hydrolase family 3 protein [Auricularia subglabra TFB-10046 SS5]|nr:glycoside hydrolase family 3 protein [Auricularia subglabra TFB-10046 SS5]
MRLLVHLSLAAPLASAASLYSPRGAGRSTLDARATSISNPPSNPAQVPDFGPAWDAAYRKAKAALARMSVQDKVTLTTGTGLGAGTCSGNIPGVDSIGFPGLCLEDGPMAMRPASLTTVFPAGINTAATFNRKLMRSRGVAMGAEFAGKGVNVAFGPAMNMARAPTGGRNWEGFGADPFLAGEAAYETILGMQSAGVQANAKHFVGKFQEFARFTSSSEIDDRTMHEIYAHPFMRSVMAGVASIMCAENRVDGTYACGNDEIQNKMLKKEWGFRGYMLSDFLATRATSDAVNGLDMTLPGNAAQVTVPVTAAYFGTNLTAAVQNGTVAASRLDDMAARILAGWYLLNQDNGKFTGPQYTKDVRADHAALAREVAAASHILLKNTNNALPLTKEKLRSGILIAGSDARAPSSLPLISAYVGALNDGTLAMGWGSGAGTLSTLADPLTSLTNRVEADGASVSVALDDWNPAAAAQVAVGKSAAFVFIKSASGEGHIVPPVEFDPNGINQGDRSNISAWNNGDNMVKAVAAANRNTIVVVHSVGTLDMESWIDNPNVTAVVWAGINGQETGNALVDVLYGKVNPSGRLPYTIAKSISDYPAQVNHGSGDINGLFSVPYTEGLNIDYRHFDAKNIKPRFEFGFGLTYTWWSYSALSVTRSIQPPGSIIGLKWLAGLTVPGGDSSTAAWFHTPIFTVKFNLKNTGIYAGTEIPQLYLHYPSSAKEPPSVLKGFDAISLKPGQNTTVSIPLTPHSLSIWDSASKGWKKPLGLFALHVGASSRDFRLFGQLPLI